MLNTTNPTTGTTTAVNWTASTPAGVADIVAAAEESALFWKAQSRAYRAELLEALGHALAADRTELVATAQQETGLAQPRLDGELTRTIFQLELFAQAIREGSYLEATIDHAGPTPLGPGPELRRMLIPIGPVAVFGSSNFPFAFSVAGGDTASALAAGNPVVIKAHSSHLLTSRRTFEALQSALAQMKAPAGLIGIVYGTAAGAKLVAQPEIKAVGFTGSLSGAQALLEIINKRAEPIPFYGELSSLNPLFITPGAAKERAEDIAQGLANSIIGSGGQLCTKPGLVYIPEGAAGDALIQALKTQLAAAAPQVLLNERIYQSYLEILNRLQQQSGVQQLAQGATAATAGFEVQPTLLSVSLAQFSVELLEECFGPAAIIIRYTGLDQVTQHLPELPGSLTAALHATSAELDLVRQLSTALQPKVGRLIYNGYPTGVRVAWAQHHGGPWPATNSLHTSVGVSALRRFLRPFVWQDAPESMLPEELQDAYTAIPRRINGKLVVS